MKSRPHLAIPFDHPRTRALAELLRTRGLTVSVGGIEQPPDVWLVDLRDPGAAERLSTAPGNALRVTLGVGEGQDTAPEGSDSHIWVPAGQDLAAAVIAFLQDRFAGPPPPAASDAGFVRRCTADPAETERCALELEAFLREHGVAAPHRVRIANALWEAADNARRHALRAGTGSYDVQVQLRRTRVLATVRDTGPGFDVARVRLESVPAALPSRGSERARPALGGVRRMEALCEEVRITSGPEGTTCELAFDLTPVRFDEDPFPGADGSPFDDPRRARELVLAVARGEAPQDVPPDFVMTVGRLLGAQRGSL